MLIVSATLYALGGSAFAQTYEPCGDLTNAYGPLDYRRASDAERRLVENQHFTPRVERLLGGQRAGTAGGDIDYTLRVFPNHPRALLAMMRLGEKENKNKPTNSRYTIGCWFDRAVRFQPEDGAVRMLYGTYLARQGNSKEAIEQLQRASELLGDQDGNAHYNLGLAYIEVKDYDKALFHAHKAYGLGFDLPGLRNKLQRAGKWKEPARVTAPPVPTEPPTPAAADTNVPAAPVEPTPESTTPTPPPPAADVTTVEPGK
ncbi:MAG TPA: tetratricopeptide repeat protein [Burkholderiales bacterium]|nr:tetratricopeptide repeat protein [Burkholderiales bacterium]